ncbi:NAD-dependent succinate-semialdehyde dehydrogenase [uncultured Arcticibacterium sp.]|uniref:NAD-dependent succinate-semialdehyde dehydrogenase n=1 Tax=uncultured Arcticibacterium sp. TaxID=2173042 RepID=UPI0030F9F80D
MAFKSVNPYNNQELASFPEHSITEQEVILKKADKTFTEWRTRSFAERAKVLNRAAEILKKNSEKYAKTISSEMGKPISEARAEVKKCAWVCEYYAENAEGFLSPKSIDTDAHESFVTYEPLGAILAIMPWNFPFWQVFRFAAPTLMAGNIGLLKHASNVLGSGKHIADIFSEAGAPEGAFQHLLVSHDSIETLLGNDIVKAVSLTGSEKAGASVASLAGKNIKKSLLELGGSNAFVVLDDADIDKAVEIGVKARFMNTGQSCIAAKRFIVVEKAYDKFVEGFVNKVKALKSGDPMLDSSEIGVLAREDLADILAEQVDKSVEMGAKIKLGGKQNGAYYEPTVLTHITAAMPVFKEETFGPVAPIIKVKNAKEAFEVAKDTEFGLGISVFTEDLEKVKAYIKEVPDGAFFVNDLVKSDPRLPFGGTKKSGFGRELAKDGIMEFVNVKTVYIQK